MKISTLLADDAVLVEIGSRIARRRLELQLTQSALAEQAGIGKRTLERIEAGASAQLSNIIRIFRVLELVDGLNMFIPDVQSRPMALLKGKGKVRQRASKPRAVEATGNQSTEKSTAQIKEPQPWSWDDDG